MSTTLLTLLTTTYTIISRPLTLTQIISHSNGFHLHTINPLPSSSILTCHTFELSREVDEPGEGRRRRRCRHLWQHPTGRHRRAPGSFHVRLCPWRGLHGRKDTVEFNEMMAPGRRVDVSQLALGDGIMTCRRRRRIYWFSSSLTSSDKQIQSKLVMPVNGIDKLNYPFGCSLCLLA